MSQPKPRFGKYARIAQTVRDRIARAEYPAGSRLPTEAALAAELGANPLTVAKALRELVAEGLVVRRRGDGSYVTDCAHPPLLPGRHLKIGVLWAKTVMPERLLRDWLGAITRGVLEPWGLEPSAAVWPHGPDAAWSQGVWTNTARGVRVEVLGEQMRSGQRHPPLDAVQAGDYDALICAGIVHDPWLEELLALNKPVVLVDYPGERWAGQADLVYADPLPAYRAAVAKLAAQGLTRIHFVGGLVAASAPSPDLTGKALQTYVHNNRLLDPDSVLRLSAYRAGMDECGLEVESSWVHRADLSGDGLKALGAALVRLPEDRRPEAVVCFSISQADALQRIFADHGFDLKAAGATDLRYGGAAQALRIDGAKLGAAAGSLVLGRIQQPDRPYLRVGVALKEEAPLIKSHAADSHVTPMKENA